MEETLGSSLFVEHISDGFPFPGIFDSSEGEKSSLGFMELLGIQDYSPSLFDLPQAPAALPVTTGKEGSEVLNQPATPNSSSISSASSEAVNDEQTKSVEQEEEQQEKTKKQ